MDVLEIVRLIEQAMGKPAVRELLPMQPGDVPETYADCADLAARRRLPAADVRSKTACACSSSGFATSQLG